MKVVRQWHRLPSEAVNARTLAALKARLDGWGCEQPGLEGGVLAIARGWELHHLRSPFQPKPFCDSTTILKLLLYISLY